MGRGSQHGSNGISGSSIGIAAQLSEVAKYSSSGLSLRYVHDNWNNAVGKAMHLQPPSGVRMQATAYSLRKKPRFVSGYALRHTASR